MIKASRDHWKPWAGAVYAQLTRAALSVQLNLPEGYARRQRAPFRYHLRIAYGSAVETADLLVLCLEEEIMPADLAASALRECNEAQALILGLLKRVADQQV